MAKTKTICAFAVASMLTLCSCGSDPSASDKATSNAYKAIEIGENYVSGDLSGDDAYNQLDDILTDLEYASNYTSEERKEDSTKYADYYLRTYVYYLQSSIFLDKGIHGDAESFDNVEEALANLEKQLDEYD